jgi:hypothetical protein
MHEEQQQLAALLSANTHRKQKQKKLVNNDILPAILCITKHINSTRIAVQYLEGELCIYTAMCLCCVHDVLLFVAYHYQ